MSENYVSAKTPWRQGGHKGRPYESLAPSSHEECLEIKSDLQIEVPVALPTIDIVGLAKER